MGTVKDYELLIMLLFFVISGVVCAYLVYLMHKQSNPLAEEDTEGERLQAVTLQHRVA